MTAALEGGEWSAARPGRTLPPGKTPTNFTGGWVGPRAGLDGREISSSPGFDPGPSRTYAKPGHCLHGTYVHNLLVRWRPILRTLLGRILCKKGWRIRSNNALLKLIKEDIYIYIGPPLWSSGQSFWLQIQRSRVRSPALPDFRSPALPDFLSSSGSGTGPTQPLEVKLRSYLNKKVAAPGSENRD